MVLLLKNSPVESRLWDSIGERECGVNGLPHRANIETIGGNPIPRILRCTISLN